MTNIFFKPCDYFLIYIADIDGFTCDFNSNDLCGWKQDKTDQFDWIRTYVSEINFINNK